MKKSQNLSKIQKNWKITKYFLDFKEKSSSKISQEKRVMNWRHNEGYFKAKGNLI